MCFFKQNPVQYMTKWIFQLNSSLQKSILRIAVPNSVENGIFQIIKVALNSVVCSIWYLSDCKSTV